MCIMRFAHLTAAAGFRLPGPESCTATWNGPVMSAVRCLLMPTATTSGRCLVGFSACMQSDTAVVEWMWCRFRGRQMHGKERSFDRELRELVMNNIYRIGLVSCEACSNVFLVQCFLDFFTAFHGASVMYADTKRGGYHVLVYEPQLNQCMGHNPGFGTCLSLNGGNSCATWQTTIYFTGISTVSFAGNRLCDLMYLSGCASSFAILRPSEIV